MKRNIIFLLLLLIGFKAIAQNQTSPIGFIENKGQIVDQKGKPNKALKYLLNTSGLNVQLRKTGFSYDVYETKKHPSSKRQIEKQQSFKREDSLRNPNYTLEYIYHRIDIDFANCNPKVQLISEGKSSDYDNYYNVLSAPEGILEVHKFQRITYQNIYPNIDVVFFIPEDKSKPVEYNFIVKPGGRLADIQLKFNGAKSELIDNKIKMNTRFGEMDETLPLSWMEDGRNKKEITIGYKKIKNNVYGFETTENIVGQKVVIDPVPTRLWGTFYGNEINGGPYSLSGVSITTDTLGNSYFTGSTTTSNSSYATAGAHQTSVPASISNGIIVKFSPNGNRLWGTYYGGEGDSYISEIKADSQNNVVITGDTQAQSNISTIGSYKSNLSDKVDVFLVKFNDSGVRLWGTYFGGEELDFAYALDIDDSNNIYIAGMTSSQTNIAINSTFQTQPNQDSDGFLAKFEIGGNLIWSTYVGGDDMDSLETLVIKDDYLVTGGYTASNNIATTAGVFQEKPSLTDDSNVLWDGLIYKFSLDGKGIWATYYGGENQDLVYTVAIDDEDNIYLGGATSSKTNMTTPGCFESSDNNLYNGFLAKLNSHGGRIWGSYFPGAGIFSLIFKNNSIYIGASVWELGVSQKLTNLCSYRPDGGFDGYIGKFSKQGGFLWGTYVGGNVIKIAIDNNNAIFVTGISGLNNGIADSNSYQPAILGGQNYYLMKFSEECTIDIKPMSNSPVCIGHTLSFSNVPAGYHYDWTGPDGFTSQDQNPTINNAKATNSGVYTLIVSDDCGCIMTYKLDVIVEDKVHPLPDITNLPVINDFCNINVTATPTATDTCSGKIIGITTDPLNYSIPGTYTIHWNYDDGNGNSVIQNQTVIINAVSLPTLSSQQTFCIQQNATISDIRVTGQNIKWYDSQTGGNLVNSTTLLQDEITYYASQTPADCESARVPITVHIQNTAAPTGINPQTFCTSQNPTLKDVIINGTAIKWYDSSTSPDALPSTTLLVDGKTYYVTQTLSGCESINKLEASVNLITGLNAQDHSETICDEGNNGSENINLSEFNSFLLSPSGNTFNYYTSLNGAENEILSEQLNTNYDLNSGLNTIYVRIYSNNNGCNQIVRLLLTLINEPIIAIPDNVILCEKSSIMVNAGAGFDSYLWSNGQKKQTNFISQPGNYSVTVTKNHGNITCSTTKNFTVSLSNPATITSIETEDWTDNQNKIIVNTTGLGDYEFSLDDINYQDSNIFTGLATGNYAVYVRDKNKCGITTKSPIYLLIYPKFFTPNNDGFHDNWHVKFSQFEENFEVQIFDRFGKLIKSMNNTESWDGTYNGILMPSDDYWFYVTRNDGQIYKGHFALKR